MNKKVFISGFGLISALGKNASENLEMLNSGKTGIQKSEFLNTKHKNFALGEVKFSNKELLEICNLKPQKHISRTLLLGMIAAKEAMASAQLSIEESRDTAFINGTSVGGMDVSEEFYRQYKLGKSVDFNIFKMHDCGHSTQEIAKKLNLLAYTSTISTACSTSANTIIQAARMIKSGMVDRVLAGGTDALSLFTLNGFNSLKILDTNWCKPFDKHRNGLNLGEGAAYLVLESAESLNKRKGKAFMELKGYGNSNDAYHQTASSPKGNGAFMAMKKACEVTNLSIQSISYINAHGTGTDNNDLSESLALNKLFGKHLPPYSSTKSFTGHTLAAAGAIEAVFSLFALQEQKLYPCLNLNTPMGEINDPVTSLSSTKGNVVLSNSFGFGGNCSSLIFSKI